MQLQQLRYFIAVVEHGGFTRAAEHLGRTQQAVSKALRLLEDELGVRLLDREAGVPRPTAFGQQLIEFARGVSRDEAAFRMRLQSVRTVDSGTVRIGASPTVAASLVASAAVTLGEQNPGLGITVIDGIQGSLVPALLRQEIDVAVYIRTSADDALLEGLATETLTQQDYRLIAARSHPLAGRKRPLTAAELGGCAWVLGANSGDVEAAWREAFDSEGLPLPRPGLVTTSIEFCRAILMRGQHLSILPLGLIEQERVSGDLVALPAPAFEWQRPVAMTYRTGSLQEAHVLAAIRALHQVAMRTGATGTARSTLS